MTGRRGRRRKQLLDDLKEKRRYWKLKEAALDCSLWRTRFGRGYGPVVRQTAVWMECFLCYWFIVSWNFLHIRAGTDVPTILDGSRNQNKTKFNKQ
jgi:hypothetical protein